MRKSVGITQLKLSRLTGISRSSIAKFELGKVDLAYIKVRKIFDSLEAQKMKRKSGVIDGITLSDIHSIPYVGLKVGTLLNDVLVQIHLTDYSQFVVTDSDRIVGSITDKHIIGLLSEYGDEVKDHKVGDYMEDPFPVLSSNTYVVYALPLLRAYQAILTREKDRVVGIVTNNDIGKIFLEK